jgi:hypothetical protein
MLVHKGHKRRQRTLTVRSRAKDSFKGIIIGPRDEIAAVLLPSETGSTTEDQQQAAHQHMHRVPVKHP